MPLSISTISCPRPLMLGYLEAARSWSMSMEVLDQESSSRDSSCSMENEVPRRFFLAIVAVAPFVKSNQNRAVSPSPRLWRFGGIGKDVEVALNAACPVRAAQTCRSRRMRHRIIASKCEETVPASDGVADVSEQRDRCTRYAGSKSN